MTICFWCGAFLVWLDIFQLFGVIFQEKRKYFGQILSAVSCSIPQLWGGEQGIHTCGVAFCFPFLPPGYDLDGPLLEQDVVVGGGGHGDVQGARLLLAVAAVLVQQHLDTHRDVVLPQHVHLVLQRLRPLTLQGQREYLLREYSHQSSNTHNGEISPTTRICSELIFAGLERF